MPVFWIQDQYVLMLLDKNHLTSWIYFLPWSSIGGNYKNIMICVRNYFLVSSFLHIVSSLVPHQCGTTSLLPTSRSIALNFHCIDNKEQQNSVELLIRTHRVASVSSALLCCRLWIVILLALSTVSTPHRTPSVMLSHTRHTVAVTVTSSP